ncbi:hypothetical protein Tco_0801990 [Tanacetum coccineum]|uniref:Uncharacterized protein n=1 Tax=Tanacetum coccineum TaxID=301880 RepID=A0ABQ5A1R3_9ASTR
MLALIKCWCSWQFQERLPAVEEWKPWLINVGNGKPPAKVMWVGNAGTKRWTPMALNGYFSSKRSLWTSILFDTGAG